MENFLDLLIDGGILMIPILLCSVIALGVFLERIFYFRRKKIIPQELLVQMEDLIKGNKIDDLTNVLKRNRSPMARIFLTALKNFGKKRVIIKESVEEVGRQEAELLEKNVGVLSVIAQITPLLGLLGTVQGMIKVFNKIVSIGVGDPSQLADGISVALVTTAAGLTVAIPTLIGHHYLIARANDLTSEMQQYTIGFVDIIKGED
jgi:biopolymer transport protein ExbB